MSFLLPLAAMIVLSPAQLREDFAILRGALEEGHEGLYRHTPKADLDRAFTEAEAAIARPMESLEFYRTVARVVAAIRCGHTRMVTPTVEGPLFPLPVVARNGKIFASGKLIQSINGVPAARIVDQMLSMTPGDGTITTGRELTISRGFASNLITMLGLRSPYEIVIGSDKRILQGTSIGRPTRDTSSNLRCEDNGKIGILRIGQFMGIADFLRSSFEELRTKRTDALIVDVRDNGGGMDDLGKMLFSYFVDQPFPYYRDIVMNKLSFHFEKYVTSPDRPDASRFQRGKDGKLHMTGHPVWGTQQPSQPGFGGKVYVLMNGGSFSTTTEFLAHMHARKRAIFIGEEAGGSYYGNTAGYMPTITLPNSKVAVSIPLVGYYLALPSGYEAHRGVMPDVRVEWNVADSIDQPLKTALDLARKNRAPR